MYFYFAFFYVLAFILFNVFFLNFATNDEDNVMLHTHIFFIEFRGTRARTALLFEPEENENSGIMSTYLLELHYLLDNYRT